MPIRSPTTFPKLADNPVPDLLICICTNGVLVIGKKTIFCHEEPMQEVANAYSRVFDYPTFLRTDAQTEELTWLATQQHDQDVLWELGEPSLSLKCWSLIEILAVVAAEAIVAIEARGDTEMRFDGRLRALRWRMLDLYKEAKDKSTLPALHPSEDIVSCVCITDFNQEAIFKGDNGDWKKGHSAELSPGVARVRASAEQMLWLAKDHKFCQMLGVLQSRFGATEIRLENYLALKAALKLRVFRDSVEDWLGAVNGFVWELERILIDGMIFPEP